MHTPKTQYVLWLMAILFACGQVSAQVTLMEKNFDFKCLLKVPKSSKLSLEKPNPSDSIQVATTYSFTFTVIKTDKGKYDFFLKQNSKLDDKSATIETEDVNDTGGKFTMEDLKDKYDGFAEKLAALFRQYGIVECLGIGANKKSINDLDQFQTLAKGLFYEVVAYAAVQNSETDIAGWVVVNKYIPMFNRSSIGHKRDALSALWLKEKESIEKIKKDNEKLKDQNKDKVTELNKTPDSDSKISISNINTIPIKTVKNIIVQYSPIKPNSHEEAKKLDHFKEYRPSYWGKRDSTQVFEQTFDSISPLKVDFDAEISYIQFNLDHQPWQKNEFAATYPFIFDYEAKALRFNTANGILNISSNGLPVLKSGTSYKFEDFFIEKYQGTNMDPMAEEDAWTAARNRIDTTKWLFGSDATINKYRAVTQKQETAQSKAATPFSWTKNGKDTVVEGQNVYLSTEGKQIIEFRNGNKQLIDESVPQSPFLVAEKKHEAKGIYINSAQFEFRNGMLENIVVLAEEANGSKRKLKFTSRLPIGFSTQKNIDALHYYWLYEDNYDQHAIRLADLIEYTQNLNLASKDYSPSDQVINVKPHERTILLKEKTAQLFEAKVFSDFVGFETGNPNGLVQTEVSKKINLLTRRMWYRFDPRYFNFSFVTYITPEVVVSKLEKNNRALIPDQQKYIVNGKVVEDSYISTMDLLNYENFSTGLDLNLFLCEIQQLKTEFMIDGGFRFGRTAIEDSSYVISDQNTIVAREKPEAFGVNTWRFYPKFSLQIFPDSRYGLNLSYQPNFTYLLDNRLKQVANLEAYANSGSNGRPICSNRFELLAHLKPNESGRFFFRYTFNSQFGNWKTNFHQAQVGYSFFLSTQKKENNESKK